MKIFLSLFRICKFAIQNFFRNFWLSLITLSIFALTLITVNAVLFMNVLADETLGWVENRVEVTIFFTTDASEDLVQSAQGYLLGLGQVRDVRFISKEDALEEFLALHQDDQEILDSLAVVDDNPLGHALIISAYQTSDFAYILEAVDTPEYSPFIQEKDFTDYESIIQNIQNLRDNVRIGGGFLAGFFILISILIIFNAIRVATYVHRDEIGIMKLVGANDWFVRGPFLLEAILYAACGTIISMAVTIPTLRLIDPNIASYFGDPNLSIQSYFLDNALIIFGGEFIILSILGMITTLFAMRRYLRV